MIDPNFLFVLDDDSEVFEDGYGHQPASRVAVASYYSDFWFPSNSHPRTYPTYKATGANGQVYIREKDVQYIVELTSDEFRPLDGDGVEA
ncbi:hypothetical protein HUG10_21420 (plasmid) [Halorarum halophilum]|uniref:Uncharacterized protein n=1 Tax=Halorarum halophilum TaxID=2743090 RepID=A0A7D5GIT1_9EURY|nr:hypothetical protein [Halobaculum halophilum]QLG30150.1 hypothetical protein HUG10_21420 [Halobaculum halophilum]